MVTMFTTPARPERHTTSGPTPATAVGKARMAAPTISVRVSAKTVQNGGRDSSRCARRACDQRRRSRQVPARLKIDASGRRCSRCTPAPRPVCPGRARRGVRGTSCRLNWYLAPGAPPQLPPSPGSAGNERAHPRVSARGPDPRPHPRYRDPRQCLEKGALVLFGRALGRQPAGRRPAACAPSVARCGFRSRTTVCLLDVAPAGRPALRRATAGPGTCGLIHPSASRPHVDQLRGDLGVQGGHRVVGVAQDEEPSLARFIISSECGSTAATWQPYAYFHLASDAWGSRAAGVLLTTSSMRGTWSPSATLTVTPVPS